jgi:3-aminobutyryl-CoA ammonia-lyase
MTVGLTVTHRRYIKYGDGHYGGGLVDGAYVLGLFGDVATEACIRMARDEGLFASYSDVQFRAPVLAGDVIEAECVVTSVGRRSRQLSFEARVVCRADPSRGPSASIVLDKPVVAVTATGTVVIPLQRATRWCAPGSRDLTEPARASGVILYYPCGQRPETRRPSGSAPEPARSLRTAAPAPICQDIYAKTWQAFWDTSLKPGKRMGAVRATIWPKRGLNRKTGSQRAP